MPTYKAILTKFVPCTDKHPNRIKAYDMDGNSVTISYPDTQTHEAAYRQAAEALLKKMGWKGTLIAGGIKNGYAYVFSPNDQVQA